MSSSGSKSKWRQRRALRGAREEAAAWVNEIREGPFPAERQRDLDAWLACPLNEREFREAQALCNLVADLKGSENAELMASIAGTDKSRGTGLRWLSPAVAAVAFLAAGLLGWLWLSGQGYLPRTYQTGVGQMHSEVLPDGSVAYLNTRTRLEWIGSPGNREVRLLEGEVYFEVLHEPTHPFRILLAHSEVEVLGTRFDVYQKTDGDVIVTVVSGTVSVEGRGSGPGAQPSWSRRVNRDEQIEYSPLGLVGNVHPARAVNVIRWRSGMIETRGERLSRFISDLSRYTSQRIVIADPRAARMRIGGAFSVRDVDATLERISRIEPITVTHRNGELIVGYRPVAGSGKSGP